MLSLVLAAIIIFIVSSFMISTNTIYFRKKNIEDISTIGYNAILTLKREIVNTGLKTCLYTNGSGKVCDTLIPGVTIGASDSSSFSLSPGLPYDTLRLLYILVNDTGYCAPLSDISIYCDEQKNLIHKKNITGETFILGKNIDALQFEFQNSKGAWHSNPSVSEKKDIHSIRIGLLIRSRNKSGIVLNKTYNIGGDTLSFADTYIRRLFTQTVSIINNGKFPS
jgi:hypothetical protein